jgi:teichuronic acid exporter
LNSKVVKSGRSVFIGSLISEGISVLSSIVLARLLYPNDYGALVLSGIFAGLITQIGGFGYEIYYLQFKGSEQEKANTLAQVYNIRLVTNVIMFLVQFLVGIVMYIFTNDKMSGGILMLMSVSLLLEGFNSPNETLLKSKMDFKKVTIGNIFKESFSTIGKVTGALLGFGGYCFGIGPILGSLTRLIYLRKVQKYQHKYFNWDKTVIRKIFDFGKHMIFVSAGMYLVQQLDRIFLNIFFPKKIVGQYGFAWGNASMPFSYLIAPQGQVTLTYITQHKVGDPVLLEKLLTLQRMILFIFMPLTVFGILFTDEIIKIAFTERWLIVSGQVRILLIYFAIQSFTSPFSGLLTGLGKPNINSRLLFLRVIFLVPSLLISGYFFNNDITYYLITFCCISVIFDVLKLVYGIRLLVELNLNLIKAFLVEIISFLTMILFYFISLGFNGLTYKLIEVVVYMSMIFVVSFKIDKIRTKKAIELFTKSFLPAKYFYNSKSTNENY